MSEDELRPDPDILLASVQKQEARAERGKLKIFFGMAAGVGKTFAMLEAAHQARLNGVDVVVGYVETHGRAETTALVEKLETLDRLKVGYRGTIFEEMDIDAVLARNPQLVLVDELAHTNAPGVRHAKRYQDVLELLENGIDVYTTVNVQHFESRADAVQQITGVTVHETIPDSIIDLANEIELIDLTPAELRKRLSEGKVYTAERSTQAADNFFRVGNLTALREMALRLTAEHVDHELQDYMDIKRIAGPWKSAERLMVAVGPSPFSEKLIRWTRRMAYNLEAPWMAAFIETTDDLTAEESERLSQNLNLARSLGGEVITSTGAHIADSLLHLARQRNVTQLVVGKPHKVNRGFLGNGRTLVDDVIDESGNIDIYVVTGDGYEETAPAKRWSLQLNRTPWPRYLWALLIILSLTVLNAALLAGLPWMSYLVVGLTGLLAVLLIAVYFGRGPALLAATVSAIAWNFVFIEPRLTFQISQPQDVILFLLYFATAIIVGNLTAHMRSQELLAIDNAERVTALYTLSHETGTAGDMDEILDAATSQLGKVFDADVAILLAQGSVLGRESHLSSTLAISEHDFSVAVWAFDNGRVAGRFTNTLPSAHAQYIPLRTPNRTVGIIGFRPRNDEPLSFDQSLLLETFANQIALSIERELLDQVSEQSAMLRESERLYSTLLNSISHELRTPIATITGAASSLADPQTGNDPVLREQLTRDIQDAGDRLNRLVANLLDMTRLESGRLKLKLDWCDIGDIIGVAVKRLEPYLDGRTLTIYEAPVVPLVRLDFVLMEQVIINLLVNAVTYTPEHTPIDIAIGSDVENVTITITDHGAGIATNDIAHVFDKFYRAPGTVTGGTGLGLSISRGLVEAHGGTLSVKNVPEAGARFVIKLPVTSAPPPVQEADL